MAMAHAGSAQSRWSDVHLSPVESRPKPAASQPESDELSDPVDTVELSRDQSSHDPGLYRPIGGWATTSIKLDPWKTGRNVRTVQNRSVYEAMLHQGFTPKEMYTRGASGKTLLQETLDANHIKDPRKIKDGTQLSIPSKFARPAKPHHVQPVGARPGANEVSSASAPPAAGARPAEKHEPEPGESAQASERRQPAAAKASPAPSAPARVRPADHAVPAAPARVRPADHAVPAAPAHAAPPATVAKAPHPGPPEVTAPAPTRPRIAPTRAERLGESLGVAPSHLGNLAPRTLDALESLPANVLRLYRDLPQAQKRTLVDKLHGSTSVLFTSINHRQAFIKGTAMGRDVFSHMQGQVEKNRERAKLSPQAAAQLTAALNAFRTMTPGTRETIVQLLEADVERRR